MGAGYKVAFFVDINPRKIGGTRHGAPIVAAEDLQPDPQRTSLGCSRATWSSSVDRRIVSGVAL